ncbi:MAG: hypothetical protein ACP5L5_08035 [Vulcanisaeta sp.]|uniref:hypothetical protein n=1 Tax=Vulcanisaeta sp. TaxID=2020871 RepID=UPI003D096D39
MSNTNMHWVFTTNPQNLVICLKYCAFGVDNEKYGITAREFVKPGDFIIFYVRSLRTSIVNAPSKCQRVFLGPYRVRSSGLLNPNHPALMSWNPKNKFNVIIEIEKLNDFHIGAVDINLVLNNLYFITNKARSGRGGWQDHMQFSIISIREEDYVTIINHLNPGHPCIKQLREFMGNITPCL